MDLKSKTQIISESKVRIKAIYRQRDCRSLLHNSCLQEPLRWERKLYTLDFQSHYSSTSPVSLKGLGILVWLLPHGTRQCMWIFHPTSFIASLIRMQWMRRYAASPPSFPCRSREFDTCLSLSFYHPCTWSYWGPMHTERKKMGKWADSPKSIRRLPRLGLRFQGVQRGEGGSEMRYSCLPSFHCRVDIG